MILSPFSFISISVQQDSLSLSSVVATLVLIKYVIIKLKRSILYYSLTANQAASTTKNSTNYESSSGILDLEKVEGMVVLIHYVKQYIGINFKNRNHNNWFYSFWGVGNGQYIPE